MTAFCGSSGKDTKRDILVMGGEIHIITSHLFHLNRLDG